MSDITLHPFRQYVLRSPALPLEDAYTLIGKEEIPEQELRSRAASPYFLQALHLASPGFLKELKKWLAGEPMQEKKVRSIKKTLIHYLIRISTRSTPYGLFAGICTGHWGKISRIVTDKHTTVHIRHNMITLSQAKKQLLEDPEVRKEIKYYSNPTLYRTGKEIRYFGYRSLANGSRCIQLLAISFTRLMEDLWSFGRKERSWEELSSFISGKGYSMTVSEAYINELIDNQFLFSSLEETCTGRFYFENLNALNRIMPVPRMPKALAHLYPGGKDEQQGKNIWEHPEPRSAEFFHFSSDGKKHPPCQADLKINTVANTLQSSLTKALAKGTRILTQLYPFRQSQFAREFINAFRQKYGNESVPLMHVFDPETGITPAGNSYIYADSGTFADLDRELTAAKEIKPERSNPWLLRKLQQCLMTNQREIILTDKDIPAGSGLKHLPDTFNVCFQWVGNLHEPTIYLKAVSGPGAGSLLGRFTHLDPGIQCLMKEICDYEERNREEIHAEIVHIPGEATGNILFRSSMRNYEIQLFSYPGVREDRTIPINDILVEVQGGKIVLTSRKHKKQILPHLSNAHNFHDDGFILYRFLCEVQSQATYESLSFHWQGLESDAFYLPRVRYENIIFSPAQWKIRKSDLDNIRQGPHEQVDPEIFRIWLKKYNIPRYIILAEYDKELLLNTDNRYCLSLLGSKLKNQGELLLKEFFPENPVIVESGNGHYMHEFIAPFCKKESL